MDISRLAGRPSINLLRDLRRHFNHRRSTQLLGFGWLLLDMAAALELLAIPYSRGVQFLLAAGFPRATAYDAAADLRKAGFFDGD